jgi:hypothetical protein
MMRIVVELVRLAAFVALWQGGDRVIHGLTVDGTAFVVAMIGFVSVDLLRTMKPSPVPLVEPGTENSFMAVASVPLLLVLLFVPALGVEALRGTFAANGVGVAFLAALWHAAALAALALGSERGRMAIASKVKRRSAE